MRNTQSDEVTGKIALFYFKSDILALVVYTPSWSDQKREKNMKSIVNIYIKPLKTDFYVYVCKFLCMWFPQRPEEAIGCPGSEVTANCERL